MKTAIRVFALIVAFVGLASASFNSATPTKVPAHITSGPGPDLPAPLPCSSNGSCVTPAQ